MSMTNPKPQPQWEKRILDVCNGDPIAVTMLVICKEEREKAERIGFDRAMQSVPNPNYSEEEVQRQRKEARKEGIRECIDSIKKMSWASWRAEEVLNNLLKK